MSNYDMILTFAAGGYDVIHPNLGANNNDIYSQFAKRINEHSIMQPIDSSCSKTTRRIHQLESLDRITNLFLNMFKVPLYAMQLSCCKMPSINEIANVWRHNIYKILNFIKLTDTGFQAYVKDAHDNPIRNATAYVKGMNVVGFPVTKNMAHLKIMLPAGEHEITIKANGFAPVVLSAYVQENELLDKGIIKMSERVDDGKLENLFVPGNSGSTSGGVVSGKICVSYNMLYTILILWSTCFCTLMKTK